MLFCSAGRARVAPRALFILPIGRMAPPLPLLLSFLFVFHLSSMKNAATNRQQKTRIILGRCLKTIMGTTSGTSGAMIKTEKLCGSHGQRKTHIKYSL